MEDDHDRGLRQAAFDRVRELSRRYDDLVPLSVLRDGFSFDGRRVSFGSFFSGIFRPKELHGPSALALVTTPPKDGRPAPYEDTYDETAVASPTASAMPQASRCARSPRPRGTTARCWRPTASASD